MKDTDEKHQSNSIKPPSKIIYIAALLLVKWLMEIKHNDPPNEIPHSEYNVEPEHPKAETV